MRTLSCPCVFCRVSDLPKCVACELFSIIFFGLYPFQNRTYVLVARWSIIADAVFFFFHTCQISNIAPGIYTFYVTFFSFNLDHL
jgi:hypothetical protein